MKNLLLFLSLLVVTTSLSGGVLKGTECTKSLTQWKSSELKYEAQQKVTFRNTGPTPVTLSIWYSDFNDVWTEVQRTHLPVGQSVAVLFDYGQLAYYGYSINGGLTITSVYADYIEV